MIRKFATGLVMATAALGLMATTAVAQDNGGRDGQGDGDVGAARSVEVTFHNNTSVALGLSDQRCAHGTWTTHPPVTIEPGATATWASESDGFATGTQCTVDYDTAGEVGEVSMEWDNPYVGENSYACSAPKHYYCITEGGAGNNASVTYTLVPTVE